MNKRVAGVMGAAALMTCAGLYAAHDSRTSPDMNAQEQQRIAALTRGPTTRCLGSYQLDLPAAFVLNGQSTSAIDGITLSVMPEDKPAFEQRFEQRKAALQALVQIGEARHPHLRTVLPIDGAGGTGGIFDRAETDATSMRAARTLELLGWKDGYTIQASVNAIDNTFPEDKDNAFLRDAGNQMPTRVRAINDLFARVSGRSDDTVPTGPGLCIANGFVSGPHAAHEHVYVAYHLEGTPDVYLGLNQWNDLREETTLLQRSADIEQEMSQSGLRTIRKGEVTYAGQPYETWLLQGPTADDVPGTTFALHGNETTASSQQPFVTLTLFNGQRIPDASLSAQQKRERPRLEAASLSVAEAVGLWDAIVPSLRPRADR